MKIRYFMDYKLEDDETLNGGVSFVGETVADFIDEMEISEDEDIEVLNKALYEAGIKPIEEPKVSKLEALDIMVNLLNAFNYDVEIYFGDSDNYFAVFDCAKGDYKNNWYDGGAELYCTFAEILEDTNFDSLYEDFDDEEYDRDFTRTCISIVENLDEYFNDVDVDFYENVYLADRRKAV